MYDSFSFENMRFTFSWGLYFTLKRFAYRKFVTKLYLYF